MKHWNVILFFVLSMATLAGWYGFVVPRVMPRPAAGQQAAKGKEAKPNDHKPNEAGKAAPAEKAQLVDGKQADAERKIAELKSGGTETKTKPGAEPQKAAAASEKKGAPAAQFPHKSVVLGSADPKSGYFLNVELSTTGASVAWIAFNDPRYLELKKAVPLKVVGNNPKLPYRTLNTDVPEVDKLLASEHSRVAETDWSVAQVTADAKEQGVNSGVTFRYPSPDGSLVLEKRYWLERIAGGEWDAAHTEAAREVRDTQTAGYLLHLDIGLHNVGAQKLSVAYTLQGPVGLPLENEENARKFRDVRMGFLTGPDTVSAKMKGASTIISEEEKGQVEEWKAPLKYLGVDVQYFAALVVPHDDQWDDQHRTIARSTAMLLDRGANASHADISVVLDSEKIELDPKQDVTHKFELFAGPKRKDLLVAQPLQAEGILDTGWMTPVWITQGMLGLLRFFHGWLGIPYGIAIICLTVVVRAVMFPVTLRQTMQAQRMKEMQPKLQEIKKKYANDKEKLAMENLRLMKEHKVNPMSGCLPLFLQLPILGGLWTALNSSVDLRRAPFLYFDNLAAPDALFHLPFTLPMLHTSDFNLLPFITVGLFVVQQKMFMPPPTDEQQAMQYKMMNVMTVVMGFMFYSVPAGLCVYLISSSLWGLGERKLLLWWQNQKKTTAEATPAPQDDKSDKRSKPIEKAAPARAGFWKKLVAAADAAGAEGISGSKSTISRRDRRVSPTKKTGKRPR